MAFRSVQRSVSFGPDSQNGRALAAQLAEFAREVLEEAQAAGEFPDLYLRAVNGRRNLPEDAVRVPGPIVYTADWVRHAAAFAVRLWRTAAPVRRGRYRDSVFVLANGREVEPQAIPFGAEVFVVSDVPYARKIHVGAKGFEENRGIAEAVAGFVRAEYKQLVETQVRFLNLQGGARGYEVPWILRNDYIAPGARRSYGNQRAGSEVTYPAIRIDRPTFGLVH
jgi:hypothetical protein